MLLTCNISLAKFILLLHRVEQGKLSTTVPLIELPTLPNLSLMDTRKQEAGSRKSSFFSMTGEIFLPARKAIFGDVRLFRSLVISE